MPRMMLDDSLPDPNTRQTPAMEHGALQMRLLLPLLLVLAGCSDASERYGREGYSAGARAAPDPSETQEAKKVMGNFETIEAGDTTTRLYATGDFRPGAPGVVVFHAWWGLNDDVVAYADRLAAAGFAVVAPDLYRGAVASTIEEADRLAGSLDEKAADAIALATINRLAEHLGPKARFAAVGFSLGAAWSMWSPAQRDRLVASVVYYGSMAGSSLTRASVPVLGHFAEADPYESDESIAAFERTLRSAGRDVVIHRYPGTGHWFAEPSRDAYRAAAADSAFERTVAFLGRHLGAPPR
jgi:carboxymethylenebutenolidase